MTTKTSQWELTWTNQTGLNLLHCRVAANVVEAPFEKPFLGQSWTRVQGPNVSWFQGHVPHIQVSDISKKRFCEIPTKRVLILTEDQNPIPMDISVCVRPWALVFNLSIHIDGPVVATPTPCDTDLMPRSIIWEGGLIRQVLSMDDERQEDAALNVQLAPQLKLIGKDRCSVREDGRHFIPVLVPLYSDTHANGWQGREGYVHVSKAFTRLLWKSQSWDLKIWTEQTSCFCLVKILEKL